MSELVSVHFYTRSEAEQLVGLVYELVYPFFGVPEGTRGKVSGIRQIVRVLGTGYELVVEWDLSGVEHDRVRKDQPLPRHSWLSRSEMERYMQRVEKARLPGVRMPEAARSRRGRKPRAGS